MGSLVVGEHLNLRRKRKMLQLAGNASLDRRLERHMRGQALLELEFDELNRLSIRSQRIRRIVDSERVERVAVARCVDFGFENRQAGAPEKTADTREQFLLIRQIDD